MEYFIIALIAVMWGWREFVKSMRLNTIEQELEGIRIWTEKKDQQFLEIQNQHNVLLQKVDKKQNNDANIFGNDSSILLFSGEKLDNEFSDEISEEKLKADYERNHSQSFLRGCHQSIFCQLKEAFSKNKLIWQNSSKSLPDFLMLSIKKLCLGY